MQNKQFKYKYFNVCVENWLYLCSYDHEFQIIIYNKIVFIFEKQMNIFKKDIHDFF